MTAKKKEYLDRFNKELNRIEKIKVPGRLLDIGCGYGFFLTVARDRGFETYGVDIDSREAELCRMHLGLNVYCGVLSEGLYPEGYFDVITIFHTLEHVIDPNKIMAIFKKILKPDGLLVIAVPHINDIRRFIYKGNWFYFRADHLWYFSRQTLKLLLSKHGFEIFKVRMASGGSDIVKSLEMKTGIKTLGFINRNYFWLKFVKNFLSYILSLMGFNGNITVYARKK